MKTAIFWNNIFAYEKRIEILNVIEQQKLLYYYLIEKSRSYNHFKAYFKGVQSKDLVIRLNSKDILNKDKKLQAPEQWNSYDALFILAELDWAGKPLSEFYGIELTQKLRLNNIKCPIFICSFMTENYLAEKEQFKILNFRSHYFIHLPKGIEEDLEICQLDEMELMDCKMHYCGVEGAIREIYHRKQHVLAEGDIEKARAQILELLEEIKQIRDLPEYLKPEVDKLANEVKEKNTITDLKIFCKADDSKILAHLKDQDKDDLSNQLFDVVKGGWQILILEDVPNDIGSLIESLLEAGIKKENILLASTYDEAESIINTDSGNKIAVVICDYRLEKEGKLKGRQGYTFVEWLSKQDRLNEIFVYSGLARRFLKETFKKYNIRVTVNSKYDVIDRMSDFVDEVIDKGNEISEIINHRPTANGWKELDLFYTHYRQWSGYNKMEQEISETAHNIIKQIKYQRDTIEKYGLTDKDIPFFEIQTFANLAGRIFKEFKVDKVKKNPELLSAFQKEYIKLVKAKVNNKTVCKSAKNKTQPKQIENNEEIISYYCFHPVSNEKYRENYFKNKLIARRIAWYLLFCEGIHINTVFSLLKTGKYFNYYFNKPKNYEEWQSSVINEIPETNDAKTLINTRLAVIKEDFPFRLLVEEKNWFKYKMGVDINDLISVICGFQDYFDNFFEDYISKMNQKKPAFSELQKNFIVHDKFVFYSANDIRKTFELALNVLDDTKDKVQLIQAMYERIDKEDRICSPYFEKLEKFAKIQLKKWSKR